MVLRGKLMQIISKIILLSAAF